MKLAKLKSPALSAVAFFWTLGILSVGYSAYVSNYPTIATAGSSQLSAAEWNKMVTALQTLDTNLSAFTILPWSATLGKAFSAVDNTDNDGSSAKFVGRPLNSSDTRSYFTFERNWATSWWGLAIDSNNDFAIHNSSNRDFINFQSAIGSVGIGTAANPFSPQGWGNFGLIVGNTTGKNGLGIDTTAGSATAVPLVLRTAWVTLQSFYYNTTGVGNITTNGSSTSYNTTSDYRLKENVVDLTWALDRISKLGVRRFDYKTNPERTVDGFLAHEVQAVVPEAVTGIKDAVDENGNPIYQQVDYSKVVPLLSAGIKELKSEADSRDAEIAKQKEEIEVLKAEISALKNAK